MGDDAKFPANLHGGYAQCWSWDYDPDDGWVYVVATGFQRDKGIILMRVRPEHIGQRSRYVSWGFANGRWAWGQPATPITPDGEKWGELTFRRMAQGKWILGGFLASKYALGYRVVDSPVANMHTTELQTPVLGSAWNDENHPKNRVAQLYGGYVLPGSRFDIQGGFGLDGVAMAHRRRMALSGNAIQSRAEGHHEDGGATRPDQPVSARPRSRRRRSSWRRSHMTLPVPPDS